MVALEGLACGRPVVATVAGGPALIVEDGVSGSLTQPGDAAALAERLERLLADDALRAEMGSAARRRAARYGWPAITCSIMQVYRETLERATLRPAVTLRQRVEARECV
jgi:D-inositol-3-phosphate glycosyltransferase